MACKLCPSAWTLFTLDLVFGLELNYTADKPVVTLNTSTWLTQPNAPYTEEKEADFVNKDSKKRKRTPTACVGLNKGEREKEKERESKKKSWTNLRVLYMSR